MSMLSVSASLPRLRRRRRAVLVRVEQWGHEVDSFETASPQVLRTATRDIYAHLPDEGAVHFKAVEEEWLPLGLDHTRREADLSGLDDALEYLAA